MASIGRIVLTAIVTGYFGYLYAIHYPDFGILFIFYLVILGVIWKIKL